jgi:hypothetical protein
VRTHTHTHTHIHSHAGGYDNTHTIELALTLTIIDKLCWALLVFCEINFNWSVVAVATNNEDRNWKKGLFVFAALEIGEHKNVYEFSRTSRIKKHGRAVSGIIGNREKFCR